MSQMIVGARIARPTKNWNISGKPRATDGRPYNINVTTWIVGANCVRPQYTITPGRETRPLQHQSYGLDCRGRPPDVPYPECCVILWGVGDAAPCNFPGTFDRIVGAGFPRPPVWGGLLQKTDFPVFRANTVRPYKSCTIVHILYHVQSYMSRG